MSTFTNLGDMIGRDRDLDKVAIVDLGGEVVPREISYAQLDTKAKGVARALAARGLKRGDRVAILSANRTEYLAAYYGIMRAGYVAVPVNFRFPRSTIHFIINDCGAKLVFCDTKRRADCPPGLPAICFGTLSPSPGGGGHRRPAAAGLGAKNADAKHRLWSEASRGGVNDANGGSPPPDALRASTSPLQGEVKKAVSTESFERFISPGEFETVQPEADEPAMFLYTSGSTGTPKGVVLSHQGHLWVVETRLAGQDLSRQRYLVAAPLYHMNALALAKLACAAHAAIVLLPQFSARGYIEAIGRYHATWLTAVPPMIAMMLRETDLLARTDLSSVTSVRMGSAPVSASLMAGIRRALPQAAVTNAYGTTEAGPVVFGPHPNGLPQPELSVGYPHPKVQLRLVDGDDRDAAQGVLEMKCPAVMLGYHNRPDVPTPITADGFYITGDVFRRDENGFYYFVGRTDDMFVSGGENIYPADVERMLERHPDVAQAAVVPIDDEIKGQKPVAFVIRKAGRATSADEIKQFALANAPAYQHPRFIWFVDELPLASTNKVDRAALMQMAQERLGRE
jgi:acyl-CoA synthetase (AMP-forming)/AMP-acid ligase II